MQFDKASVRILVRKDYGACYDFYTEKMGLAAVWGDRYGPYTSFAVKEGEPPCLANIEDWGGVRCALFRDPANKKPDFTLCMTVCKNCYAKYRLVFNRWF